MPLFDEIQAAYRQSQDTYRDYLRRSLAAAQMLARHFREYLGAPESYADPDDDTHRPYVRLLAFQIQDGNPAAAPPQSQLDLLARDDDGYWRFAIALTIDRDAAAFPKQSIAFFLRLKIHDGVWHVQLLDDGFQDFAISPGAGGAEQPLFEHMVAMVKRVLAAKPWEGIEKLPIGFELHPPEPPLEDEPPPVAP